MLYIHKEVKLTPVKKTSPKPHTINCVTETRPWHVDCVDWFQKSEFIWEPHELHTSPGSTCTLVLIHGRGTCQSSNTALHKLVRLTSQAPAVSISNCLHPERAVLQKWLLNCMISLFLFCKCLQKYLEGRGFRTGAWGVELKGSAEGDKACGRVQVCFPG